MADRAPYPRPSGERPTTLSPWLPHRAIPEIPASNLTGRVDDSYGYRNDTFSTGENPLVGVDHTHGGEEARLDR